MAAQIERETEPGQLVAIVGRDWSPEILYYAHRWGRMITGREATPISVSELQADGYVIYSCPSAAQTDHCDRILVP